MGGATYFVAIVDGAVMQEKSMEDLVAKSASTDVQVALTLKENAKRAALDDPSHANIAALERASKMLEEKMQTKENLKSISAVLEYLQDNGRKIEKTKLYDDINKFGRIKKQKDGTFKIRDVDRYMASLQLLGTPDGVAEKAADRQRQKETQEIRRIRAVADKEEFDLKVKKGKYIAKDDVYNELATRSVALASGIKSSVEARCAELIHIVGGSPKKTTAFMELFEQILDERLNEYSQEMAFEVTFVED